MASPNGGESVDGEEVMARLILYVARAIP